MGWMVAMPFVYTSVVTKGMKSEFRSFLPASEEETELVPELQADQNSLLVLLSSFKAAGVGTPTTLLPTCVSLSLV